MAGDTCMLQVYKRPPTSLSSSGDAARVPPWAKAHPIATLAPEQLPFFFVFLIEGRHVPACLPLLLLSGDIETNPGPYLCPTCNRPWTRRTGGIQCGGCDSWTHYNIQCSGVRQHGHIPQGWRCFLCHPSHNMTLPPSHSPCSPYPPSHSPGAYTFTPSEQHPQHTTD